MQKMQQIIKVFIFFLLVTNLYFAQNGKIVGIITDENNLSLVSANIYIEALKKGVTSDENGKFVFSNLNTGNYEITFSYLGYQTKKINIDVLENKTLELNVILNSGILFGEEVVVLGDQLIGQAKALNQQKENMNITNIVSSDQIGRFPDANIGDALKRITSITVNYDQGEARFGNIRGTEPRLNSFTINGERIPSAEAEIRNVQLDLVPSDMVQTIEVNKAVTPEMDADAIGGSVNLITKGAPNKLRLSTTLGGNYNQLSEKAAFNGAFTVGQRFADDVFGILLNGSYHDHELGSDNTEGAWDNDEGNIIIDEWEIREYQIRRLRQSIGGTLDFRINPFNTIYLKGIYSNRKDWENRYRVTYSDDTIERQTKGGISGDTSENARLENQKMFTLSLSGDHAFDGNIKLDWSAGISRASEERPNERYITWAAEDVEVQFDLSDLETPKPLESVSLSQYVLDEISEEYQFTEEKDFNAKVNFEIPLLNSGKFNNKLKIGARLKNKDKERDNNFFEYTPLSEPASILDWATKDYTNPNFLAGDYKVGTLTSAESIGSLDLDNSSLFEKEDKPDEYAASNFNAAENVIAGYLQLNQNLGNSISMIAGIRFEQTDIDFKGYQFDEATEDVTSTTGKDNYSNFLPGIHFKFNYDENTILRFAWTNTIARPNYYDLVPYRAIAEDNEELAIGNPSLKPTTSMNFDLNAEKYLESVGILSGGIFYKSIDDYIYVYSEEDYADNISGNTYDEFFQPRNGASANLFGVEFAFQRRLDFLGSIFKNLNFYSNYTFTNSNTDNPVLNDQVEGKKDIELPGTSPHIVNANLTYQNEQIVLGISFNYTAAYLDPDELDLTPGLERYYDSVVRLDLNGSYAFTPNLRLFIEANNLTNQPLRYYAGTQKRTYQAEYYDLRFNAGIKFDL
ncbi:MAG: TonB-dependent receptor [Ignavibacteriae bacterium]|nr:TonB-dependent receptor [Ignavibacteriota bacterium]